MTRFIAPFYFTRDRSMNEAKNPWLHRGRCCMSTALLLRIVSAKLAAIPCHREPACN